MLIATLDKVFNTMEHFYRAQKTLFTSQNSMETSWKKIAHFFQHARSRSRFLWLPLAVSNIGKSGQGPFKKSLLRIVETEFSVFRFVLSFLSKFSILVASFHSYFKVLFSFLPIFSILTSISHSYLYFPFLLLFSILASIYHSCFYLSFLLLFSFFLLFFILSSIFHSFFYFSFFLLSIILASIYNSCFYFLSYLYF
jgi:hypothetical protein